MKTCLSLSRAAPLLFVALLPACAYRVDPGDQPTARVRMVSAYPVDSQAALLNGDCVPFSGLTWEMTTRSMAVLPRKGGRARRDGIGIPMTNIPPDMSFTEQVILAGKPISLAYITAGSEQGSTCAIAVRFTPQANTDYETLFFQKGHSCFIVLYALTPTSSGKAVWGAQPPRQQVPKC